MEDIYKEVRYDEYCKKCKHEKLEEYKDVCHECLSNPTNLYSIKPVRFEEKGK